MGERLTSRSVTSRRRFAHVRGRSVDSIRPRSYPEEARRRACRRSSVCVPPSASSGVSRPWPGSTSMLEAGEIVLLSGANGAGKTTLLRLLAGLVPLYSGEAMVLGHDLAIDRRGARRDLALVGHETFCYDDLTVRGEPPLRRACRRPRRRRRADAALERLGLTARPTSSHRRLSAGPAPPASRSRSRWSRDPRLLLLDEPHAGLDADGRAVARRRRAPPRPPRAGPCSSRRTSSTAPAPLADREVVLTGGPAHVGVADRRRCRRAPRWWCRRDPLARGAALVAGKDLRIEARSRVDAAADRSRSG